MAHTILVDYGPFTFCAVAEGVLYFWRPLTRALDALYV